MDRNLLVTVMIAIGVIFLIVVGIIMVLDGSRKKKKISSVQLIPLSFLIAIAISVRS